VQRVQPAAERVRDLAQAMQAHRLLVIDPFQRHAGGVRAQHLLRQPEWHAARMHLPLRDPWTHAQNPFLMTETLKQ
jgi:hypothetical protein